MWHTQCVHSGLCSNIEVIAADALLCIVCIWWLSACLRYRALYHVHAAILKLLHDMGWLVPQLGHTFPAGLLDEMSSNHQLCSAWNLNCSQYEQKFRLLIFSSSFHNLVGLKYLLEKRPVLKLSKGCLIYRPVKPEVDQGTKVSSPV